MKEKARMIEDLLRLKEMEATMRASRILRGVLEKSRLSVHAARLKSVLFAVDALLTGGRLSCAGLGRSARSRVKPKHNIKRIDRLLGNGKLQAEHRQYFAAIARSVISEGSKPIILIDWTKIEDDKFSSLTASVPIDGRSIPILWCVYEDSRWGNRDAHKHFLLNLALVLPDDCEPILVTDAGFQNPWFRMLTKFGWDWVGRLSIAKIRLAGDDHWTTREEIYQTASTRARSLGVAEVGRKDPMHHRVVLGKQFRRNPKRPSAPRRRSDRSRGSRRTKKRAMEPWILVSSLVDETATEIDRIYRLRMLIEESFRDTKSHRFGWSFEDARCSTAGRYATLLLVATLAMFVLLLIGCAAEQKRLHFLFQANTKRNQRVLSLFFLGKQLIHRPELRQIRKADLRAGLLSAQEVVLWGGP